MSYLTSYWRVQIPAKSPAEVARERWLFTVPLRRGHLTWQALRFSRWHGLAATVLVQVGCGSIYAFPALLRSLDAHFATSAEVTLLVAMTSLGLAAAISGPALERRQPRFGMGLGGACVVLGLIIAHVAVLTRCPALLVAGYGGLVGGGFGLASVASFAAVVKWFPDLRGLSTGATAMGFGAGLLLWSKVYMMLLGLESTTALTASSDLLRRIFPTSLAIVAPIFAIGVVVVRSPPPDFTVHGLDMHCMAAPSRAAVLQDEYFKVGMTLVNLHNTAYVGADGHYYEQVKALSLAQCLLSSDFALLYLGFAASVAPSVLTVARLSDMAAAHVTGGNPAAAFAIARTAAITSLAGRLLAPVASDALVYVFYANPAFARKLLLLALLAAESALLPVVGGALMAGSEAQLTAAAAALTFACGGVYAIVPCLLCDLYGVFHVGTMYGLLLACWAAAAAVVGAVVTAVDVGDVAALERLLRALCYVLAGTTTLVLFVRTSSADRFFPGYRFTVCGCVLVQIPFARPVAATLTDAGSMRSSLPVASHRCSFYLWVEDDDSISSVPSKTPAEAAAELWLLAVPGVGTCRCVRFRRWHVLLATFLTQLICGSLYAYPALVASLDVHFLGTATPDHTAMTRILLVALGCLGFAAAVAGPGLERRPPRVGMLAGTVVACVGLVVAHVAIIATSEALLILGYGVLVGMGFGLLLVVSIATAQKWYPDYRATCLGVSVLGFGAGLTLCNKLYLELLGLETTTDVPVSSAPLRRIFPVALAVAVPVLLLCSVAMRSPPATFAVNGVDMHCVAAENATDSAVAYVQDEFFKVGMTLVNFDAIRASNDAFLGTDGHYYQQVKALSLAQCLLSTDFALLYIAFAAAVAPSIVMVSQLVNLTAAHFTGGDSATAMAFARIPVAANLAGRLLAPLASDAVVRVFYANPAFARKVVLLALVAVEGFMLVCIAAAVAAGDYAQYRWAVSAMTFACGGAFAIVPCLLSDLYGVFNMGTMYGLILTSWCAGVIAVGAALSATDVGDAAALIRLLHALGGVLAAAWLLLWGVRTNSADRFFPGYQLSACGKVFVQLPFGRTAAPTLSDEVSSSTDARGLSVIVAKSPPRSSFFLWHDNHFTAVDPSETSSICEEASEPYWHIEAPTKSPCEEAAERWFVAVPRPCGDGFVTWHGVRFRRWQLLLATVAVQLCCGVVYAYPVLSPAIASRFDGARAVDIEYAACAAIGMIGTFAGPALERHPPRAAMALGSALTLLGLGIAHAAVALEAFWLLVAGGGVLLGAGSMVLLLVSIATVQKWFPNSRGLAMGVSCASFALGIWCWCLLFAAFAAADVATVFPCCALVAAPVLMLSSIAMRSPPLDYVVNGVDVHCIVVGPAASVTEAPICDLSLVHDTDVDRASPLVGTTCHYYHLVKTLSLAQCLLSTDFIFLYVAFAAGVAPNIVFMAKLAAATTALFGSAAAVAANTTTMATFMAGQLLAPPISDVVIRVFYANPAFARKVALLLFIGIECVALLRLAEAIAARDQSAYEWCSALVAFTCGCAHSTVPCLVIDLDGVYHMGTVYGLIAASSSFLVLVVGLDSTASGTHDLVAELRAMSYVLIASWLLLWLVRTNSPDRFFPGYQVTLCGRVLVQIPFGVPKQAPVADVTSGSFYRWDGGDTRGSAAAGSTLISLFDPRILELHPLAA
ncbi:Major Facilitator Superfamily (MFS) [Achlya hypogyna]|uniref:Major Facilitator Superfamily (MFS) n=1 Tax=Achlya hypogyna TaxID=1202772 RepID=A0A1V9YCF5_ACHHY|nr:Major Facilitator Superfamily (MFS) [Achlya hypogyna]